VTAFQVGEYGRKSMKTLPNIIFDEIDSFVYAPNAPKYATELLHSSFDGDKFAILARARMSAFARKCASDGTSPRPCERESLRTRARLIRHGGMEEERASSHLPCQMWVCSIFILSFRVWAVYYKQIRKSEQRPPLHLRAADLVPQPRTPVCHMTIARSYDRTN